MPEYVGKCCLDLTYDSGNDLCAEDPVLNEILQLVQTVDEREYSRIIAEKSNVQIMYHLSRQRQNIILGLDIEKDQHVLEIGSESGALTGKLAQKAGSVTCIEESKIKSYINAYRNQQYDNIEIKVGAIGKILYNCEDEYDVITLIGSLAYAPRYIKSEQPVDDLLKIVQSHLNKNGKLVIAIENKYGLRYWAGCREDYTHKFFRSIEGFSDHDLIRTFSKSALQSILENTGFRVREFYYPYPDYIFTRCIYSDDRLPEKGELNDNLGFSEGRMYLFHEDRAYDNLISDEMFPQFSNSFLLVCTRGE